jgi:hypothetical protein
MKPSQAIEELRDILYFDDSVVVDIMEILEEIAAEYHRVGYEDGLIDAGHYDDKTFTAYGKKEDFV